MKNNKFNIGDEVRITRGIHSGDICKVISIIELRKNSFEYLYVLDNNKKYEIK